MAFLHKGFLYRDEVSNQLLFAPLTSKIKPFTTVRTYKELLEGIRSEQIRPYTLTKNCHFSGNFLKIDSEYESEFVQLNEEDIGNLQYRYGEEFMIENIRKFKSIVEGLYMDKNYKEVEASYYFGLSNELQSLIELNKQSALKDMESIYKMDGADGQ